MEWIVFLIGVLTTLAVITAIVSAILIFQYFADKHRAASVLQLPDCLGRVD